MAKPLFSVIIPTLNEEKFLPKLLTSLSEQTKKNFEVIVVDGSSKDKTVAVAKSFSRTLPSLQIIVSKTASLPLQRNLGAKAARGEWLIFVDADSVFMPHFVERVQEFIQTHDPHVFTTWFSPDSTNPKDAVFTLFANVYTEATVIFKKPLAPGPLTIVHKDAFDRVGGYDEEHTFHEDVDFGLRLYRSGIRLDILRETLYVWSLRRFRKEGTLKVLNQYVLGVLPVVFLNTSLKRMPGYTMGGQLYKKKGTKRSVLLRYERKIRKLLQEFFG